MFWFNSTVRQHSQLHRQKSLAMKCIYMDASNKNMIDHMGEGSVSTLY